MELPIQMVRRSALPWTSTWDVSDDEGEWHHVGWDITNTRSGIAVA